MYNFWPTLAIRILKEKVDDDDSILRKVDIPKDRPKQIAPSIALKPIPKASELVQQSLSRFVRPICDPEEPTDDVDME